MADDGDYPFVVYVENRFLNGVIVEGPIIKVTRHFYDKNDPHHDPNEESKDPPDASRDHYIHPRDALCFPLYWKKEYLEITLMGENETDQWGKLPDQYRIWSGPMARVKLYITGNHIIPGTPAVKNNGLYPSATTFSEDIFWDSGAKEYKRKTKKFNQNDDWYLEGGIWIFKNDQKGDQNVVYSNSIKWTLYVYKLVHDPEEENVTIGENPPT